MIAHGHCIQALHPVTRGDEADIQGYMSDYKPIPKNIIEEDLAKMILYSAANVRGVFVCNREEYKQMIRALDVGGVKPIVDKVSQQ